MAKRKVKLTKKERFLIYLLLKNNPNNFANKIKLGSYIRNFKCLSDDTVERICMGILPRFEGDKFGMDLPQYAEIAQKYGIMIGSGVDGSLKNIDFSDARA